MMQNNISISAACQQIIAAGHTMIKQKMVTGSWGNLSVRIDDLSCAITPSGRSYETLTEKDIVIVDMAGNK